MLGFAPLSAYPVSYVSVPAVVVLNAIGNATVDLDAFAEYVSSAGVSGSASASGDFNRIQFVLTTVEADAQVVMAALRTTFGDASVTGTATATNEANRFTFTSASVSGSATDSADGIRIRLGDASMLADATANGGAVAIFSFDGEADGVAVADLLPNIIASAAADMEGEAVYIINAELIGENWTVVPQGTNVWLRRG